MAVRVEDVETDPTAESKRNSPNRPNKNLLSLGKLRNSGRSSTESPPTNHVEVQPVEQSNEAVENLPPPPSYDTIVRVQVKDEVVSLPSTSQLPRYNDVAGLKDAPPTYHSLFSDKVFRVINPFADDSEVDDSTSQPEGGCKLATLTTNFVLFVFLITFVLLLPIGMITIGIIYVHKCPIQPRIPIYLIVLGFFQMLECCGRLGYKLFQSGQRNTWRERYRRKDPLVYFVIVWFVIGSMWVYQTNPSCQDPHCHDFILPSSSNTTLLNGTVTSTTPLTLTSSTAPKPVMYCDKVIYNFAFWIITTYYSVIGFFCLMLLVDVLLRTLNRCFCPQH